MRRGEVLFQGPTHHKNQQNVKLTFQEFVLNWGGGGGGAFWANLGKNGKKLV